MKELEKADENFEKTNNIENTFTIHGGISNTNQLKTITKEI